MIYPSSLIEIAIAEGLASRPPTADKEDLWPLERLDSKRLTVCQGSKSGDCGGCRVAHL